MGRRKESSSTRTVENRLRTFCRVAEEAVNRRAIQEGTIAAGFKIRGERGKETEFTANLGDVEDVRSLMLDVRKFFL